MFMDSLLFERESRNYDLLPNQGTEAPPSSQGLSSTVSDAARAISRGSYRVISTLFCTETYRQAGGYLRNNVTLIDYSYVIMLRAMNNTYRFCLGNDLFNNPEEIQTRREECQKKEIEAMRKELGEDSIYSAFSQLLSQFCYLHLEKSARDTMEMVPERAEAYLLWWLGLHWRYVNYKFDQKTGYRDWLLRSRLKDRISRVYSTMSARIAHTVLSQEIVLPFLNFQHVFLRLSTRIKPLLCDPSKGSTLNNLVIRSISESITLIEEADETFKNRTFRCPNDALIVLIAEYHRKNKLPRGFPNPDKERLSNANLDEKLVEALYTYLDEVTEIILEIIVPKIDSYFIRGLYCVEGKDCIKGILKYLIGELVIKLVVDPHQLVQTILSALDFDSTNYDPHGFGRDTKGIIFTLGRVFTKEFQNKEFSPEKLVSKFREKGLKVHPQSEEEINQVGETEVMLKEKLFNLLYDTVKGEDFRQDHFGKKLKQKMKEVPLLGLPVTILYSIVNVFTSILGYMFRSPEYRGMSITTYVTKYLIGQVPLWKITQGITDLIYHPSWRFIILHLLEDIMEHLQNKVPEIESFNEEEMIAQMKTICRFAFLGITKHAAQKKYMEPLFNKFATDDYMKEIKETFKPSGKPLVEVVLETLHPMIKEMVLYYRLVSAFRMKGVVFEGDDKFWEVFVRGYLDELTTIYIKDKNLKSISIEHKIALRVQFIDLLLDYDDEELIANFSADLEFCPLRFLPEFQKKMPTGNLSELIKPDGYLDNKGPKVDDFVNITSEPPLSNLDENSWFKV